MRLVEAKADEDLQLRRLYVPPSPQPDPQITR